MSKKKNVFFIKTYDKDNNLLDEYLLASYCKGYAIRKYLDILELLVQGEFCTVYRVDLVSSNHILFSCQSLKHVVNQKNFTINFNPY